MRKFLWFLFLLPTHCLPAQSAAGNPASLHPIDLRCEYLVDPAGIDVVQPGLSWRSESTAPGARGLLQSAYQIVVASTPRLLDQDRGDLWDTGKVSGAESIQVIYGGNPLASFAFCFWKVRVWDGNDAASGWSATAQWSMGPLAADDWGAQWIGKEGGDISGDLFSEAAAKWIWREPGAATSAPAEPRFFRKVFMIPDASLVRSAICRMTADDGFRLLVNGREVGKADGHPHPLSLDLAADLITGKNVLAVAAYNKPGPPMNPAGLIGALRIEFADGHRLSIATDASWRASSASSPEWERPEFDDGPWFPASVLGDYGMAPWGLLADQSEHRRLPARMLRRTFGLDRPIARATAYVCGLGFFELYLNGQKISDHVMDPAISNYAKHVCYVTFDVTGHLKPGENAVGVILGNARFFAPRLKVPALTHTFGYPRLFLLIRVEHEDGSITNLVSDDKWKLTDDGPIRANSEYDGEEYEAGREMPGWSATGFDDTRWQAAQIVPPPPGVLTAQRVEPMRVTQVIEPTAITNPKPGVYIVDFGQSLYGSVQLRVRGPRGTRVQIRTSFARRPDGTLKTEDNRSALTTDLYTLRGDGAEEVWSPRFRGQGTRFAEITGFPRVPTAANFAFQVIHTDMERVGEFNCSNDLLNQIYANAVRSIRMQNRSVPMEPDRDERQPWLGHPAKSSESEGYVYGVDPFYNHFLAETRSNQRADGNISDGGWFWDFFSGDPVWPSVITVVPLWLHNFYGDQRTIAENYPAMKAWMLFQQRSHLGSDFTMNAGGYGDWVDASTMDAKKPDNGSTSPLLVATAYFYHNCRLVAEAARILGKTDDARSFDTTADHVAEGFNRRFFDPKSGMYESATQLSGALPLAFGLVPEAQRPRVAEALADDIVTKQKAHLSVGLIGMQWYMQVLTQIGRPDLAYTVATQTTRPSWGYMISRRDFDLGTVGPGHTRPCDERREPDDSRRRSGRVDVSDAGGNRTGPERAGVSPDHSAAANRRRSFIGPFIVQINVRPDRQRLAYRWGNLQMDCDDPAKYDRDRLFAVQ